MTSCQIGKLFGGDFMMWTDKMQMMTHDWLYDKVEILSNIESTKKEGWQFVLPIDNDDIAIIDKSNKLHVVSPTMDSFVMGTLQLSKILDLKLACFSDMESSLAVLAYNENKNLCHVCVIDLFNDDEPEIKGSFDLCNMGYHQPVGMAYTDDTPMGKALFVATEKRLSWFKVDDLSLIDHRDFAINGKIVSLKRSPHVRNHIVVAFDDGNVCIYRYWNNRISPYQTFQNVNYPFTLVSKDKIAHVSKDRMNIEFQPSDARKLKHPCLIKSPIADMEYSDKGKLGIVSDDCSMLFVEVGKVKNKNKKIKI